MEEIQDTSEEDEKQFHDVQMTDQSDYSETEEDSSDTSHPETAQPRRSTRKRKKPVRFNEYVLTYQEAIGGPDKLKWEEAIRAEKESLKKNATWELVDKDKVGKKKY